MSSQKHPYIRVPSATKSGYETAEDGDGLRLSHIGSRTGRGRVGKKKAQALTTQGDAYAYAYAYAYGRVRRLLPIECERLMGWEDEWTKYGINEPMALKDRKGYFTLEEIWQKPKFLKFIKRKVRHNRAVVLISDSQRYKMCGNGVVSGVVRELVKNLFPA